MASPPAKAFLVKSGASHHRQRQRQPFTTRTYVVLATVAAIPLFFQLSRSMVGNASASVESSGSFPSSPDDGAGGMPRPMRQPRLMNAEEIIQWSYKNTFGSLPIEKLCHPDVPAKKCFNSLLSETRKVSTNNNNTTAVATKSFPWWFMTMLRDSQTGPPNGHWHNLSIMDPPIDFCTIEKIATTQWRHVQCYLNEGKEPVSKQPMPCHLNKTRLDERQSGHASRVVMLRDPLERLLSGYINKCVTDWRRAAEKHCEPMTVFDETELTAIIRKDPKQLFAAYVDAYPLKWNVHFFPQGIYCNGLFRHVQNYDFVGYMGKNFYKDLAGLAAKVGGKEERSDSKLSVALDKVFHFSNELNNTSESNVGKETRAPEHVKEYYTAASVRRALEYFAVDYVLLGLEVPDWVHDILAEENEMFMI